METRDQWYKPNLLYNIHYRPPKKPEPPKLIVETVQFNPSVCTCGEHGCQPQYRMEKRVLWTNKEVCNAKQQSKINDSEKKNENRENELEEKIAKQDREIGSVIERKQMGFKKKNVQEFHFMIKADGNKCGSAKSFKERMSGDVEVRSGGKANCEIKEKEKVEIEDDDDTDNEKEEKQEVCVYENKVWYSDSKEARKINNINENNNDGRRDKVNSEDRNSREDPIVKEQTTEENDEAVDRNGAGDDREYCSETRILIDNSDETAESCSLVSKDDGLQDMEIASEFGIMSIYCNSELHSWVSFEGGVV